MDTGIPDDRMILDRDNKDNRGSEFNLQYSTTINTQLTLPEILVVPPISPPQPVVWVDNTLNIDVHPEFGVTLRQQLVILLIGKRYRLS